MDDERTPSSGTAPFDDTTDDAAYAADAAEIDHAPDLGKRLASRRTILSFILAFALLGIVVYRMGPETLSAAWAMIRTASAPFYLAAIAAYYTAFPIRGFRWRVLLENAGESRERLPSVPRLSGIIFLSWFVNSIVPAKLGDVYRGYLLRRHGGSSWSLAMGTIVAERILDLVVLVVLMVATGLLAYRAPIETALSGGIGACFRAEGRPDSLSCTLLELFELGALVAVAVIVGLVVFARHGHRLQPHLPERFAGIYQRFAKGLVLSFARFPLLIGLSVLAWFAEGTAFWLVGRSLGQDLPLPLVVFFSLLQAFITVIPVTPGGLGFEVLLAGALRLRGYTDAAAWAMTALYRSITYLSLVVVGSISYLILQIRDRRTA